VVHLEVNLLFWSWPGHSRSKNGVASARLCPGHPRLWKRKQEDVDGRNKSGHDGIFDNLLVQVFYNAPQTIL
jgi:hypothetical protein